MIEPLQKAYMLGMTQGSDFNKMEQGLSLKENSS